MASENFFSGMFQPVVLNPVTGAIAVAVGYQAQFYAAGTDTPQTIYTDSALQIPYPTPSNIAYLDDTGKALIYLGLGGYKLVLTDPNDVPVPGYTIDNIQGIGTFGTGFVNSFADLVNVNTNLFPYTYIGGYYAPGDGGEGMFYNQVSGASSNGGYIQDSAFDPTKKWFRVPDENGEVRAASFGYIPQFANASYPVGYAPTTQLQAADAYAEANNATLSIQGGSSATITAVTLASPYIRFEANAILKAAAAQTITFSGIVQGETQTLFGTNITAVLSGKQIAIPEWFGANAARPDNMAAFVTMFASGAGGFKVNPGTWVCSALTPPTNARIISFGKVWDGSSVVFIPIGEYYLEVGNALLVDGPISSLGTSGGVTTSGQLYGASLQTVGDALVGGNVDANNANITLTLSATTGSFSGSVLGHDLSSATTVQALAGIGTQHFKAAGRICTSEANLAYTIPANTLNANGMGLRIYAYGGAAESVVLNFDSIALGTFASFTSGNWIVMCELIRLTSSTALWVTNLSTNLTSGYLGPQNGTLTGVDFTTTHTILAVPGANTQKLLLIDIYPV